MRKLKITAGDVTATATMFDTPTADAIWEALPIRASANIWGDEIYFGIPVMLQEAEDAKEVVDMGALGYWSPGHAFCIFFGPTPMSLGNEIRPASPVNVFGQIDGDAEVFYDVEGDAIVLLEQAD